MVKERQDCVYGARVDVFQDEVQRAPTGVGSSVGASLEDDSVEARAVAVRRGRRWVSFIMGGVGGCDIGVRKGEVCRTGGGFD